MRYLLILLALSGCTTTQVTACEKAKEYIAAAELAIARVKAACGVE